MSVTVSRTFFAWHRTGFASALAGSPAAGQARATIQASVTVENSSVGVQPVPVELAGPGDVQGLDPAEIRRCEPYDGCPDFEPSYLPYVELASADLPWRFSPLGPVTTALTDPEHGHSLTQQRVQPWLALVVVPADLATVSNPDPPALPTLTCDAAHLPDPTAAWAWAHVQVTTTGGQDPATAVDDPTASLARIVCGVRLAADTAYRAFLVPTFRAGRRDGSPGAPLDPAWGDSGPVTLPVYYSFGFATAQAGSFEALARRLRPRPAPDAASGTVVRTGAPGWGATGVPGGTTLMQGALRPLPPPEGSGEEPPPDPALAAELPAAVSSSGLGPQLRPPIYGQDYAGGTTAVTKASPTWLVDLNGDPRRRLAAGLGAWAVAVEQDDLCDQAWQQLAEAGMPAAGDTIVLAATLTQALGARHTSGGMRTDPAGQVLARLVRPGGSLSPRGLAAASPAGAVLPSPAGAGGRARALPPVSAAPTRQSFAPVFKQPGYELLRAVAPQWLLPGAADIPDESVILLRTNPRFTESFLVGVNHALARELTWRRYPLDPTGTMFSRFWSTSPAAPTDGAVPPIASWAPDSRIGDHTPSADQVVLLIRGTILRRFPTAVVYLAGLQADGTERRQVPPTLAAGYSAGTALFGFPLTPQQVLHPPAPTSASDITSWSMVIQEAVDHVRFGCDDATGSGPSTTPATWRDLDWDHPHLQGKAFIPIAGPLQGITRPLWPNSPPVPSAVWGGDAAQTAAILQRPAFRVRIPASLWLDPPPST